MLSRSAEACPETLALVFLQFVAFKPPPPFMPNSGAVLRLTGGGVDTLSSGINLPTSVRFRSASEIFVSVLTGQILHIESIPTGAVTHSPATPETFVLYQNNPNPFKSGRTYVQKSVSSCILFDVNSWQIA